MSSWKRWNSTKFVRLELTVKTLALFKYGANKLNSMSQNKKMSLILSRSDFSMIWRYYGIPCVHFYLFIIFLFRTNGKKGHLDENDFRYCYCNLSKVAFWKPLERSYIWSSFSTIYEAPWQHHFERLPVVENVMDIDQHMCWIFHQDLSELHQTEIDKGTWKKYQLHKNSSLHFEEHCTILDNLLTYWIIFTILKFMQCRYFFYKDE